MRFALEPDLVVVGEAENGEEALVILPRVKPNIVLMDVALPGMDGIAATQTLRDRMPGTSVVMLTLHDDSLTRIQAVAAGAAAVVGKHENEDTLLETIRRVAAGTTAELKYPPNGREQE